MEYNLVFKKSPHRIKNESEKPDSFKYMKPPIFFQYFINIHSCPVFVRLSRQLRLSTQQNRD